MKLIKDSPFNSQKPFQNLFAPEEFEIDTTNLLNYEAGASTISEPTLPALPATDKNSTEGITSFSNSLSLSPRFPNTDFTPPEKNRALDALTGEIIGERAIDYSDKDALIGERRTAQLAPTVSNPQKPPIIQNAELKFTDSNNQPFPNNQPILFITATNVLLDSSGFPLGSQFSDLIVKFFVGRQAYEATVLTNQSRTLPNNQFEIAVQVPNTVPLGESRIVLSRKQNEKVSPNPSAPLQEVKYDSTPYRIENDTQYIFAAQWTADRISLINGANPAFVVGDTNSSKLLIDSIAVGTDDILDRPRELTVTSDGSRAYVVMDRSGRVAVVDTMTRQQVDTQPNTAGINPINLPSGSEPRSIVIDPRDRYAYIADGKIGSNSIYVLDINPFSSTYHQVTQTIPVGTAPAGLRQIALSSDGKKLFVTAPNGANSKIYAVNIDPKDRPISPGANPKKWNQLIGTIAADEGVEGIASTVNPLAMTFTNSNKDSNGFGVLDITNNDPLSFAATTRYTNLGLGSDFDYFDVNEGVAVTVLPDASYAFVVGRNNNTALFGRDIASVDGDTRAGSNIGIIKDPLTNPQLVAATRPIPGGFATDLVLSNDSKYLYASYPSITGAGRGVYLFDIEEFIRTLSNPGEFQLDSLNRGSSSPLFNSLTARPATVTDLARVPIDDINPAASLAADYQILTAVGNRYTYGTPPGSKKAPVPVTNARGLAATPLDWLDLTGPGENTNDLTPTFDWEFKIPDSDVREINLFVSTFPEGEGLLPWDIVVNLPDTETPGIKDLNLAQQRELLQKWNSDIGVFDDNPNRILTANWTAERGWVWNGGQSNNSGKTSFTLDSSRTLTAGQTYHWAVEARSADGRLNTEVGEFKTSPVTDNSPFSSVTILTHGFVPQLNPEASPPEFFEMADNIANAGGDGLILSYHKPTGLWVPVDRFGQVMPDFPEGANPATTNYLEQLALYMIGKYGDKPLVLVNNWAQNNESTVPDSGFTEGAADAFYASLVQLDMALGGTIGQRDSQGNLVRLYGSKGNIIRNTGDLFSSPMHFIGFSRGTVVNSEIAQRLLETFPFAGGSDEG
ncbi:MAG: YncE family protein, partial [Microcoleus sp. CAN_BIN18]|nr:YncE family protein [Microcoleus sp. CAN_BIN18]